MIVILLTDMESFSVASRGILNRKPANFLWAFRRPNPDVDCIFIF